MSEEYLELRTPTTAESSLAHALTECTVKTCRQGRNTPQALEYTAKHGVHVHGERSFRSKKKKKTLLIFDQWVPCAGRFSCANYAWCKKISQQLQPVAMVCKVGQVRFLSQMVHICI